MRFGAVAAVEPTAGSWHNVMNLRALATGVFISAEFGTEGAACG